MSVRQLHVLRPASLFVGLALLAYTGCSSSGGESASVTHPTMIEVSPEDFLGDVPCVEGPGLKRYVATLFDTNYVPQGGAASTSDAEAGGATAVDFQLPSSPPTPCLAAVGFGLVVAGRHYDVVVEGYETDDLVPLASGSREMVSPATEANPVPTLLTPRWTARCEDAVAVGSTIVRADHCSEVFKPEEENAQGSVRIELVPLLDDLECGEEPGQVAQLSVSLDAGEDQPRVQTVPCEAGAEALFVGLDSRARVSAYVTAFSADETQAFAGATCDAYVLPEASVDADCSGLSQVGTLRVDLQSALATLKLACNSPSLTEIQVSVPGAEQPRTFVPSECLQPFEQGFPAGDAVVTVTAISEGEPQSVLCGATVAPGKLVVAECELISAG